MSGTRGATAVDVRIAGFLLGTGVRRCRKSRFLERLPAARDRAVPPSGWRGVFTLVTRHGLGAPGFVEVPRARRRGQTRTRGMEVARRWRRSTPRAAGGRRRIRERGGHRFGRRPAS